MMCGPDVLAVTEDINVKMSKLVNNSVLNTGLELLAESGRDFIVVMKSRPRHNIELHHVGNFPSPNPECKLVEIDAIFIKLMGCCRLGDVSAIYITLDITPKIHMVIGPTRPQLTAKVTAEKIIKLVVTPNGVYTYTKYES